MPGLRGDQPARREVLQEVRPDARERAAAQDGGSDPRAELHPPARRGDDPQLSERFLIEARAQARIQHENVCKIYEAGEIDGTPYIAMQSIQEKTLREAGWEIASDQKARLIMQIAVALHAARWLDPPGH